MKSNNADPKTVFALLNKLYPDARCELNHASVWQLLLATILSAQCTDVRVNKVTAGLFKKYPSVTDINDMDIEELKNIIKPTGFYNNKAKSIKGAAAKIVKDFNGQVPQTMEELLTLPGVARKTANVVLGNGFNINEGLAVDTHVTRLSQRLGWTENTTAEKIERDLLPLFPRKDWAKVSNLLIFHGRYLCSARKPQCDQCPLKAICPAACITN